MRSSTLLRLAWWASLALLPLLAPAREARFVISATAVTDYLPPTPGGPQATAQTYAFYQGRYFGGGERNRSLEQTSFESIARTLAVDLAKQGYLPSADPQQADLLLMIHWGATQVYEEPDAILATDRLNQSLTDVSASAAAGNGLAYTGALNEQLADRSNNASLSARYLAENAKLLGYTESLREESTRIVASVDEQTMRAELAEERYFIIVMAYDYRSLREQKRQDVRWITRISVRGRGHNFFEALPALSRAGGDYFGRHEPGLNRVRLSIGDLDTRRAVTEIGEARAVEEPPPPASGSR